ncbi:WAT1-related protein [Dichanthelium oligosanthes]|uniref:WAT1-related protein n=1 Tax=Dichanthelium oligosanthes TaxID=888268 RepID=A0A1E5W5R1_9POAL|nr:WAT1-related protein [Dichanthelium oligosanthes]
MRSLHRLDAAKHLFYPSTAQAEAAHAKEDNNGALEHLACTTPSSLACMVSKLRPMFRPDDIVTRSAVVTDTNTYESPKHVAARTGGWKAPVAMVLVQLFQTGLVLLSKVVISHGMFVFALVTYRSAFGAAFLLPFSLICERDKWREMMNWRVLRWIIFNAFIGYAVPINLYYNGLRDTTSSYAIIFLNIIPLITFILSLMFKMERLRFATVAGSLKIVGVLTSVGGTMVITLYKGRVLHLWNSILQYHKNEQTEVASNHLRGTILLAASSFAYASWYLIQLKVHKVYPYKYWSSMATCLVGGFMTAFVGVVLRRDGDAWKLGWDLELLTTVYSGALSTAGKYSLNSWVVAKRGPAYPPMFSPLSVVFVVVLGSIILGDSITVGRSVSLGKHGGNQLHGGNKSSYNTVFFFIWPFAIIDGILLLNEQSPWHNNGDCWTIRISLGQIKRSAWEIINLLWYRTSYNYRKNVFGIVTRSAAATDTSTNESPSKHVAARTGGWKAPVAMVLVQLFLTGLVLLSKVVIGHGIFVFALVTYRSTFGAAFLLPLALICERDKWREMMNWRVSRWIIFNAFIGYGPKLYLSMCSDPIDSAYRGLTCDKESNYVGWYCSQSTDLFARTNAVPMNLYYNGLRDTTPSYAIIFLNIIPLITFILSLAFKMDRLQITTVAGSLKIVGVLASVGGTMVISLYKGKVLHLWNSILQYHKNEQTEVASNRLRGTILLVASSFTFACWYLIQSKVHKVYPYKYWSSMATCLVGGFMTAFVGVVLRRDGDAWKLGWDLELLTTVYSGALPTAAKYSLNSWVVAKQGPAYPPMFSPLSVVFVVVLGSILLGDNITVGRHEFFMALIVHLPSDESMHHYGSGMHTLHRLDVAKHLFYPSTAEAEAANAKESNNGGGGGGKPKPPRIKRLRRLPEPSTRFFPFPSADDDEKQPVPWPSEDDTFMLLSPSSSEGRILYATEWGRTILYDADAHATSTAVPSFVEPMGRKPIAFSVPGTGGFMDEKESLYVMRSAMTSPPAHNPYSPAPKKQDSCSGDFVVLDFDQPSEWQPLPRPPFVDDGNPGSRSDIRSCTVVDGGRTICVSSKSKGGVDCTYCFDTATREWRHAGDWKLPFEGRAEYVPELKTWIGLSPYPHYNLCASDLSAMDAHRAPTLQHVWDDFTRPAMKQSSIVLNRRFPQYVLRRMKERRPLGLDLVNLGSGRFCTVKTFEISRCESVGFHENDMFDAEEFTVLTGVEVVRSGGGEEGKLRMVKHKSKRALARAAKYSLNSWVVAKQGPAYPPMFSPLSVVFVIVLGSILLGDNITVGRLVSLYLGKYIVETHCMGKEIILQYSFLNGNFFY